MKAGYPIVFLVIRYVFTECCGGLTVAQDQEGNKISIFGDLTGGNGRPVDGNNNVCRRGYIDSDAVVRSNCCRPNNALFYYPHFPRNDYACVTGEAKGNYEDSEVRDYEKYDRRSRGRRSHGHRNRFGGYGRERSSRCYRPDENVRDFFVDDINCAKSLEDIIELYWKRQNYYKCAAITNNTLRQAERCLIGRNIPFRPANVSCVSYQEDGVPVCAYTVNAYNLYKTINFTLSEGDINDPPCRCGILVDTPDLLTLNLSTNGPAAHAFTINFLCPTDNGTSNSTDGTFLNSANGGNFFGIDSNGFFVFGKGLENLAAANNLAGLTLAQTYNNLPISNNSTGPTTITPTVNQTTEQLDDFPDTV